MKATLKELKSTAKELNEVLGLDPAITAKDEKELVKLIKKAITLIDDDEFTKGTQAVINELQGSKKKAIVVEEPEEDELEDDDVPEDDDADEDDVPEEDDEDDEPEEVPEPKKKGKKVEEKKPAKKAEPAKKTEEVKEKKGFVAAAYNRVDALCDALKGGVKSIDDWSQKADKLLVKNGGTSNDKENKFTINYFYKINKNIDLGIKLPAKG